MGKNEKIHKKFSDYYKDPEYRQRHLDKLNEKVTCECGFVSSAVNLKRHQKGSTHSKRMNKIDVPVNSNERIKVLAEMKKRIDAVIKELMEV